MTDPFDAATNNNSNSTASDSGAEDRLIDTPDGAESRLFGGESLPSIMTKKVDVGDSVTGIIKDKPFEKQSRFYSVDGAGKLKFWGSDSKPTENPTGPDGKPNRPCMDLVIPLNTEYRFSAEQLEAKGLSDDSGARGWYVSGGDAERQFKQAIRKAGVRSLDGLIGMRLTVKRVGQEKKGEYATWKHEVTLTRP